MSTIIESLERRQLRDVPAFKAGDTVRVHFKVIEGNRQRVGEQNDSRQTYAHQDRPP